MLVGAYGFASNYGVDLYFNEPFGTGTVATAAPQITAYLDSSSTLASGIPGATQPTFGYAGSVPNGALSFVSGSDTVTLSNFAMRTNPDSTPFASFDLTVAGSESSATPEPGTISMGLAGAMLLIVFRGRLLKV